MSFNIDIFERTLAKAYDMVYAPGEPGIPFEEVEYIILTYFATYKEALHREHPPISVNQLRRIIEKIPYCELNGQLMDLDADTYDELIRQHFRTRYENCDYNINHFFSGDIRANRYYETCY